MVPEGSTRILGIRLLKARIGVSVTSDFHVDHNNILEDSSGVASGSYVERGHREVV